MPVERQAYGKGKGKGSPNPQWVRDMRKAERQLRAQKQRERNAMLEQVMAVRGGFRSQGRGPRKILRRPPLHFGRVLVGRASSIAREQVVTF